MGVASATVSTRRRSEKEKKRRALKPRKAGSTDVPVRTNGAVERRSSELRKFGSRRTPRRAVASDARPFRARERRDQRGRKRLAPVRASVRPARARACRSTAPKYRSTTDFPLQTSNRGPRKKTARARKGARGEAPPLGRVRTRASSPHREEAQSRARGGARTRVARVARARTRSNGTEIRDAGRLVCADPGDVACVPNRDARARVDRARGAASCRTCALGHPRGRRTIVVVGCVDELRAETRVSVIGRTTIANAFLRLRKPTMERVHMGFLV